LSSFRDLSISVQLDLFDKFIGPILSYACEVWGVHKAHEIENVHLEYCKKLLCVKRTTQNDFVYGELGRYPLYITRYVRIVKYWLSIIMCCKPIYVPRLSVEYK
jgi:hypothetical protein